MLMNHRRRKRGGGQGGGALKILEFSIISYFKMRNVIIWH